MNQVNFLPETFVRTRAAKKRRFGHVGIAAMVAAVLGSWWYVENSTLSAIRDLEHQLEAQVGQARTELTQVQQLTAQRKVLMHQDQIRRQLAQPVSHTHVIEMIGQVMPRSITMIDLTMVARRDALPAAATKTAKPGNAVAVKTTPSDEALLIEFSGLAPNDVEVANLVGALSDNPAFTGVKMLYSRSVTTRGVIGREFRMELQVPLDRDYRPHGDGPKAKTQEVAHAG
mgnify:CR=1 FL=1